MARVVCLGGSIESLPIIERVQELGFKAIVVDDDPDAAARGIADTFIQASCYHGTEAIRGLNRAGVWLTPDDGMLCCAVDAPVAAAEVAQAFGLRHGLSVEAARLSSDKMMQKSTLMASNILTPDFWFYEPDSSLFRFENSIIKPVDSRGGRGVIRLLPDVNPVWAYEQAKAQSSTGRVMIEHWLDGPQLSTESIVQNGRVLFTAVGLRNYDRLGEFPPYCVEDGYDEPWDGTLLLNTRQYQIDSLLESACRVMDWYQSGAGIVKGDLVIHDGKIYILELATRLSGGFFASHGHPLTYGVDFIGEAIKAALGYTLEQPKPYPRGYVCQRYVFPMPDDIGKRVDSIAPIPAMHGVRLSMYNIKIGQTIGSINSHPSRWGQATAQANTPEEARRIAGEMVKTMKAGVGLV